jgi:hypothetical protein
LRDDAAATGEISHWAPCYFMEIFQVSGQEVYLASQQLVSLGLAETFDPGIEDAEFYPCKITDIVLTPKGATVGLGAANPPSQN